ncbi:MAG: phosphatidylcholine/phosphatidylserine synthase [Proteobacteria bacterium]|nr:phosphatidylcholine/phosphatidylserine synthase [Pseudomonadota bacterium]
MINANQNPREKFYNFSKRKAKKMPTRIIQKIRSGEGGYFPLIKLLPNIITLASLCIGLTAIRYSINGEFMRATSFLLLAGFMDGIDGRLARFFNSSSDFGAQLDSLADFVNFGIVPGFVIYIWVGSYANVGGLNWALVLFFAVCSAIRLARFNVDLGKATVNPILEKYFFKGIPAPCGAAMAMLPMVLFYEFGDGFYVDPFLVITYTSIIAVLMASRIPTISIKKIPIKNEYAYVTLLILGSIIIGLLVEPWLALAVIGITYFLSIPVTIFIFVKIELAAKKSGSLNV